MTFKEQEQITKKNSDELLKELSNYLISEIVRLGIQNLMELERDEHIGAGSYERGEERRGQRNGYKSRTLYTPVGSLILQVPQTRDGQFYPSILERYQRSEKALALAFEQLDCKFPFQYPHQFRYGYPGRNRYYKVNVINLNTHLLNLAFLPFTQHLYVFLYKRFSLTCQYPKSILGNPNNVVITFIYNMRKLLIPRLSDLCKKKIKDSLFITLIMCNLKVLKIKNNTSPFGCTRLSFMSTKITKTGITSNKISGRGGLPFIPPLR